MISCNRDDSGNMHALKGEIKYADSQLPIKNITIDVQDNLSPFNPFPGSCENFSEETITDEIGEFELSFESYCDAHINFILNDSLKNLYPNCHDWNIIDNNGNEFKEKLIFNSFDLITEPGREYKFSIELQPVIFFNLNFQNLSEEMVFDSIAIHEINFFQGNVEALYPYHKLHMDGSNFENSIETEVFYTNGNIFDTIIEYDYFDRCSHSLNIEI